MNWGKQIFSIIILSSLFLLVGKSVFALPMQQNCGWGDSKIESERKCCWPSNMSSGTITDGEDSSGLIGGQVGVLKKVSGFFGDFLVNIGKDAFDLEIDESMHPDKSNRPENVLKYRSSELCKVGTYTNKTNPEKPEEISRNNCVCAISEAQAQAAFGTFSAANSKLGKDCARVSTSKEKTDCISCLDKQTMGGRRVAHVWTSIGCIPLDMPTFIGQFVLTTLLGLAGILSVGCLIFWAIQLQTRGAEADTIKKAKEGIRSCLLGLMLVIFSIFIIRLVGVSILGLPGLG